jgi:ribosomal protein S18 acetylase RimI-like enzyme
MQIRIAKPEDVPELFEVRTSVRENLLTMEEMATLGITHASLTAMIESGTARAWCVESDDKIVGFSMAEQNEREIFALFILPEYEGRGFGSALLENAVNWLLQASQESIRLNVEPGTHAFSFYKKRGWREIGSAPKEDVLQGDIFLEFQPESRALGRRNLQLMSAFV